MPWNCTGLKTDYGIKPYQLQNNLLKVPVSVDVINMYSKKKFLRRSITYSTSKVSSSFALNAASHLPQRVVMVELWPVHKEGYKV